MRNSLFLDNAKARQLSKVSVLWAEILSKTPINRIKAAIFFIIVFLFCCFFKLFMQQK